MARNRMRTDHPTFYRNDVARRMKAIAKRKRDAKGLRTRLPRVDECKAYLDLVTAAFAEMLDEAAPEVRITLHGFGTLETRVQGGKKTRNPKTGEGYYMPPHRRSFFVPGKWLKGRQNRPLADLGLEYPGDHPQ